MEMSQHLVFQRYFLYEDGFPFWNAAQILSVQTSMPHGNRRKELLSE